jgi:predicted GNAT family acetyltransferase
MLILEYALVGKGFTILPRRNGVGARVILTEEEEQRLSLRVEAEETPTSGQLRLMDRAGNELGHMRFRREDGSVVVIEHTEVDGSLRGQNGGRRFFDAMVAWARKRGLKIRSECPFTTSMFQKTPSARDLLV